MLYLALKFSDNKTLELSQSGAQDIGDYVGPFVRQKCFRHRTSGNGDYRDGFVIFFRPDADGKRNEIAIEYGCEVDFSSQPPKPARGIAAAHAPAYTATIAGAGTVPVTIQVPRHAWGTRWRWQSSPRQIVRSYADLVAMKAILPLDKTLVFDSALPKIAPAWKGPMDTGGLVAGMGTAGDRPELGPITDWQAGWLLFGGAGYEQAWRAQAEATGSMPFWVRDSATGNFVDLSAHPSIAFNDAYHVPNSPYHLPAAASLTDASQPFRLQVSHMPDAASVPWLLTDDPYFLEGAQATAQFATLESNGPRINYKLPRLVHIGEPRGWAWGLRDLFRMAAFAPETTPSWLQPRKYWQEGLPDNRALAQKYLDNKASPCTSVFGLITHTGLLEPFMTDYIVQVLAWAKWTGKFPEWDAVLNYAATPRMALSDYTGASNWDARLQVPYIVPVIDGRLGGAATGSLNQLFNVAASPNTPTSWAELWKCYCQYQAAHPVAGTQTWTDPTKWSADGLATFMQGYLPEARSALAALSLAGVSGARERHDWLRARMPARFGGGAAYKWSVPPA